MIIKYNRYIKENINSDIDPFSEEDWTEKEFNYLKYKGTLISFLNQFRTDDNMIDSFIRMLEDKNFMINANKDGIIKDLQYNLIIAGVDDEKSLNKIEKEISEDF